MLRVNQSTSPPAASPDQKALPRRLGAPEALSYRKPAVRHVAKVPKASQFQKLTRALELNFTVLAHIFDFRLLFTKLFYSSV